MPNLQTQDEKSPFRKLSFKNTIANQNDAIQSKKSVLIVFNRHDFKVKQVAVWVLKQYVTRDANGLISVSINNNWDYSVANTPDDRVYGASFDEAVGFVERKDTAFFK